ncbi:MAG TPA: EthD family reductase [Ferruginibacter sp.]|nr:EthD family reductase [Ferruginibacter sp.]
MLKVTVLYGHPTEPDVFEKYYSESHLPLVPKVQGILKSEFTTFLPNPDGSNPASYRMAELYFSGPDEMQQALGSEEGKAMAGDLTNFASGGVTILFGKVD